MSQEVPQNVETEIEALSDEALEDVAGGELCSYVACSNGGNQVANP